MDVTQDVSLINPDFLSRVILINGTMRQAFNGLLRGLSMRLHCLKIEKKCVIKNDNDVY